MSGILLFIPIPRIYLLLLFGARNDWRLGQEPRLPPPPPYLVTSLIN